jgi:hypothetical protein
MKTRARDFLEKAVALDPGDAEAAEQLSTAIGALKGP